MTTPLSLLREALALALLFLLAGCPDTDLRSVGLEGCVHAEVWRSYSLLHVIRCPNSSTTTTYRSGKTNQSVTVTEEPAKTGAIVAPAEGE